MKAIRPSNQTGTVHRIVQFVAEAREDGGEVVRMGQKIAIPSHAAIAVDLSKLVLTEEASKFIHSSL